jgi:hypothetical protein
MDAERKPWMARDFDHLLRGRSKRLDASVEARLTWWEKIAAPDGGLTATGESEILRPLSFSNLVTG